MSKTYIVVRHGSNAANQSMRNRMVLGTVTAETWAEAKSAAAEKWTFYNNQHSELIDLAGRTKKADRDAAAEADALAAGAAHDAGAI